METQANTPYVTLMDGERWFPGKKNNIQNLIEESSARIVAVIRKRLEIDANFVLSEIVITSNLAHELTEDRLGFNTSESINTESIDFVEPPIQAYIEEDQKRIYQQVSAQIRERVTSLLGEQSAVLNCTKWSTTISMSNSQPSIQRICQNIKDDVTNNGLLVTIEYMEDMKSPSPSQRLAKTVIPAEIVQEIKDTEKSPSMSRVIERSLLNLFENLNINIDEVKEAAIYAAAFSRLMSLKYSRGWNPPSLVEKYRQHQKTRQSDQEFFKELAKSIRAETPIDGHEWFTISLCCPNASGIGLDLFENVASTEEYIEIKGWSQQENSHSIADRFHGVANDKKIFTDDTIQRAFEALGVPEHIFKDLVLCTHNAFGILLVLFAILTGKIAITITDQELAECPNEISQSDYRFKLILEKGIKEFIRICTSENGFQQLEDMKLSMTGELYGGHAAATTAPEVLRETFEHCKNNPEEPREFVAGSVGGPLQLINFLWAVCHIKAAPVTIPSTEQQEPCLAA